MSNEYTDRSRVVYDELEDEEMRLGVLTPIRGGLYSNSWSSLERNRE